MDLLVEKGNNKTYLSQLGFLVTSFEEGAPTIARNSTNIQGRSGSVDFGGWHENKKVKLEGFYRAEDQYEEETLKERLFALLSDPEGIYITEMRGEIGQGFERPGETEGEVYEHMMTRPSHKRFYVYASSIENEFQGNVGGTVLYKMSVEFTTLKIPYGESVPRDLDVKPNVPYYGKNLLTGTKAVKTGVVKAGSQLISGYSFATVSVVGGETYTYSISMITMGHTGHSSIAWLDADKNIIYAKAGKDNLWTANGGRFTNTFTAPSNAVYANLTPWYFSQSYTSDTNISWNQEKFEAGTSASPWTPAPEDPEYNQWYINTYYNTDNLVIPYAGTVPCSQLEQGFSIEFTAKESGSNFKLNVNGTELTYNGQVYNGDVLKLSGYEYTKNGLSVVRSTNKAYFKLLPNVTNTLSSSLHGTIKVLNFQNLYA
jgi:hypothetical protein|nr:MAG TPA: distal tail protein [Caudoviricetes sp.]